MKWRCESHDSGWLVVVELDDETSFANHLSCDQMKSAHDPAWVFWSAIRSLSRSVRNFEDFRREAGGRIGDGEWELMA